MGVILGSKVAGDNKVIFTVSMEHNEALQLQGHIDDIHLFSEKTADTLTNISSRGRHEATKYFLIPRQMRKNLRFGGEVRCQKFDTKSKIIFIYMVDKF
ncbi:hypothetical protein KY317_03045 [Candidatus Woesearchaeota archaeon]|nr:hypothetical protein [Candidatus Woesearchaeota archaeon]